MTRSIFPKLKVPLSINSNFVFSEFSEYFPNSKLLTLGELFSRLCLDLRMKWVHRGAKKEVGKYSWAFISPFDWICLFSLLNWVENLRRVSINQLVVERGGHKLSHVWSLYWRSLHVKEKESKDMSMRYHNSFFIECVCVCVCVCGGCWFVCRE